MVRGSLEESPPNATQIIDVEAELHTLAIPPIYKHFLVVLS